MDARSYTTAVANRARGGGCECPEYYPCCEIQFMNLANIHSIRKSFHALRQLYTSTADQLKWVITRRSYRIDRLTLLLFQLVQSVGSDALVPSYVWSDARGCDSGHGGGTRRQTGSRALLGWLGSDTANRGSGWIAARSVLSNCWCKWRLLF